MAKVIIFGVQDFASLAHFYLKRDTNHQVVAFCVHQQFMPDKPTFEGLPVVPFEEVESIYPVGEYQFFAPMSHRKMNHLRAEVFASIKKKGYKCISYISSKATVWMPELIGENCFILEDNTIQPFMKIGDNVVLWSGNHLGHHGSIGDHVMFTSHVVLSGHCHVRAYSFFGVNATIRDGLTIAEGSLIAMGSMVTRDTDAWGVYKGSPAKKGEVLSKDLDF